MAFSCPTLHRIEGINLYTSRLAIRQPRRERAGDQHRHIGVLRRGPRTPPEQGGKDVSSAESRHHPLDSDKAIDDDAQFSTSHITTTNLLRVLSIFSTLITCIFMSYSQNYRGDGPGGDGLMDNQPRANTTSPSTSGQSRTSTRRPRGM